MELVMRNLIILLLTLVVFSSLATAQTVSVGAVRIAGTKKTDPTSLALSLTAKPGLVSMDVVNQDIKTLFSTGFFDQVTASVVRDSSDRGVLKYDVVEKPLVRKVFIEGSSEIRTSDIEPILDYKIGRFYDSLQANKSGEKVVTYYQSRGFYDASIEHSSNEAAPGQVDITFRISEGEKYKISEIRIEGLTVVDEDEALKKIQTTEYKWWSSWLLGTGRLNKEMIENDRNLLKQELYNYGLIDAVVSDAIIEHEDKSIKIKFVVKEGSQYRVGKLEVTGDLLEEGLERTLEGVESKTGEIFNRSALRADATKISEKFSDIGYAFVNVIPGTKINAAEKLIDLNFQVAKGNLSIVDRINIRGNQKSYDNVIRREMAIAEQDLFSSSKVRRSQELLLRSGYFEEANVVPENIPGQDKVNLNVNVKEGTTGSLSFGAGYSTADGVLFNSNISENNLFGTGRRASIQLDIGTQRKNTILSFEDPRLNDSQWSLGTDILQTDREFDDFDRSQSGGSITAGYGLEELFGRFGRDMRFSLRYSYLRNNIKNVNLDTAADFIKDEQGRSTVSSITPGLMRNTIDNPLDPTNGSKQAVSFEYAGIGGNEDYYLFEVNQQWFEPLTKIGRGKLVFSWRTKFGYGESLNDEPFPLFNRYFPGGINSVRGFRPRRLGPKDENGSYYGGSKQLINNLEFIFPIATGAGFKGVIFYDFGQAYDDDQSIDFGELRHAAGYGIRWSSPLGPIRLEFGYPLDKETGDSSFVTLFAFGAPF
jgi:outer membrane protein insertion porin family